MATVGANDGGREIRNAVTRNDSAARRIQTKAAQSVAARRLPAAEMTPPVVVDTVAASTSLKVVLQKDLLNLVETPSDGAVEVEFTIDADGGIRAYLVIP